MVNGDDDGVIYLFCNNTTMDTSLRMGVLVLWSFPRITMHTSCKIKSITMRCSLEVGA